MPPDLQDQLETPEEAAHRFIREREAFWQNQQEPPPENDVQRWQRERAQGPQIPVGQDARDWMGQRDAARQQQVPNPASMGPPPQSGFNPNSPEIGPPRMIGAPQESLVQGMIPHGPQGPYAGAYGGGGMPRPRRHGMPDIGFRFGQPGALRQQQPQPMLPQEQQEPQEPVAFDPSVQFQVSELEKRQDIINNNPTVDAWRKRYALGVISKQLDQWDPQRTYRRGGAMRSQTRIHQAYGQDFMMHPDQERYPGLGFTRNRHGELQQFQYKREKPEKQAPVLQPIHEQIMAETGHSLDQLRQLGMIPHRDQHGALKFHNIPQPKQAKDDFAAKQEKAAEWLSKTILHFMGQKAPTEYKNSKGETVGREDKNAVPHERHYTREEALAMAKQLRDDVERENAEKVPPPQEVPPEPPEPPAPPAAPPAPPPAVPPSLAPPGT